MEALLNNIIFLIEKENKTERERESPIFTARERKKIIERSDAILCLDLNLGGVVNCNDESPPRAVNTIGAQTQFQNRSSNHSKSTYYPMYRSSS